MSGNIPVVTATFETNLQAKINAVDNTTPVEDMAALVRAGELIPTIDNTAIANELQIRLDTVNATTSVDEYLELAAVSGKVTNNTYNSLYPTGNIISTVRAKTPDGKNLLAIDAVPRLMTPTEKTDNPNLADLLSEGIARSNPAIDTGITAAVTTPLQGSKYACDSTGQIVYYAKNTSAKDLMKYTPTTGETLLLSYTDDISSVSCSSDGQTIAVVGYDNSAGVIKVSVDEGSTFQDYIATPNKNIPRGLYVSQDGTKMAALMEDQSGLYNYFYWDDLQNTVTPTSVVEIETNLLLNFPEITGAMVVPLPATFTDDCENFCLAVYGTSGGQGVFKVSNQGTIFEKIPNPILEGGFYTGSPTDTVGIVMDTFYPDTMFTWAGNGRNSASFYTADKGVTWKNLPNINRVSLNTTGTVFDFSALNVYIPELSNKYLFIKTSDESLLCLNTTTNIISKIPLSYNSLSAYAFKWDIVRTKVASSYMITSSDNLLVGETHLIDKVLPASDNHYTSTKIIGD